ncbi:beta-ketoacyl synthase N-terminal-like domain-containing protein [Catenovulum agarivorans]|uniref:beta-ketoacyl synthase N-terminal-like domain-containing protein n=1 Tax=Catenovulum agarivorans TaxID=1172192 RepID=UPI0002DA55A0|nr:beta-ketoacyl synthase N-terminal-like domain-containing protein [Catenovulum agarivorans]
MPAYIQQSYFHAACGTSQALNFNSDNFDTANTSTGQSCHYYFMAGRPSSVELDELIQQISTAVESVLSAANFSSEQRQNTALLIGSTSLDIGAVPHNNQQSIWLNTIDYLSKMVQQNCKLNEFHLVFNTACTASFNAVITAEKLITSGKFQHVVVVGCEFYNQLTLDGFSSLDLISKLAVQSFLPERDGLILGEGVAALLIGEQAPNRAQQIKVHRGASGCDLYSLTMTDEQGTHISQIIRQAIQLAKIEATQVELFKAHATATENNDLAEAAAIENCFAVAPPVWALKPFTGHTLGACGALELAIMDALLQQNEPIPTHTTSDTPSIVRLIAPNQYLTDYKYILLNHCGFGGNNAAMVAEIMSTEQS